jgi:hypothetical protein
MELWRRVWREGFAPNLPIKGLRSLRNALVADNPALIQGSTCYPPCLQELASMNVEACCPITYCGYGAGIAPTVGKADVFFQEMCDLCDQHFAHPSQCGQFLSWVDDVPRDEMRRELLSEVELAIKCRDKDS